MRKYRGALVLLFCVLGAGWLAAQEPAEPEPEQQTKTIKMYAQNWSFSPSTIRVKQGTRVVLEFESRDAPHSFVLKAFGLKVNLPQDKKTRAEFVADKVGEFRFRCGRPCGNGCPKMTGKVVVIE
jgi:heme/copper-type cytochrome/quinol oxidase subunit 2